MTMVNFDSHLRRCHLCGGEASIIPDPNAHETGVPNQVVCKRCGDEFHIAADTPTIKTGEDIDIMSLTGCSERDATLVCWWNQHQRENGTSYSARSIDPEAYIAVWYKAECSVNELHGMIIGLDVDPDYAASDMTRFYEHTVKLLA